MIFYPSDIYVISCTQNFISKSLPFFFHAYQISIFICIPKAWFLFQAIKHFLPQTFQNKIEIFLFLLYISFQRRNILILIEYFMKYFSNKTILNYEFSVHNTFQYIALIKLTLSNWLINKSFQYFIFSNSGKMCLSRSSNLKSMTEIANALQMYCMDYIVYRNPFPCGFFVQAVSNNR